MIGRNAKYHVRMIFFEMIFRQVSITVPGPDGRPYTAWKSAGVYGRIVLLGITDWMMQGLFMPLAFGDSLLICIGK